MKVGQYRSKQFLAK